MPAVPFSNWWASLTTAFPFSSSSPTLSSPTPGCSRPITSRAYTEPRCAKPTSSRASQSTLAPPSITSTKRPGVGNGAPIAARCTPSCSRNSSVAAAITAPVLPAEMNASEASFFWRPRPTAIEERGLLLIAASGFSPIPTTSGASTTWIRLRSTSSWAWSAASTSAVRPTSWIWNVGGSSRSAWTAPSTSTRGALSPPIASSAIRITSGVLDRDPLLSLVIAARRAHPVPRHAEQQLPPHRRREVDRDRVRREGIGIRVLFDLGVTREQRPDVGRHYAAPRRETAAAFPRHPRPERAVPIESPLPRRLQPSGHRHRVGQRHVQPGEQGVGPGELGRGLDGSAAQLSEVNL